MAGGAKARILGSFVLGTMGLFLLHTEGRLLRVERMSCLLWLIPMVLALEMTRSAWDKREESYSSVVSTVPSVILFSFLVLHLFSSGVDHAWTYFLGWIPGESYSGYFRSGLVRFVFLTALFWPVFLLGIAKPQRALVGILLLSQVVCLYFFFWKTGGHALYRDDHPSFMFRLWEFSRTYPQLVNYSPYWNGGSVGYVESTSGTTSLGLVLWPLWRYLPIHQTYTYALGFLFIILVPLMTAWSLRIMGAGWSAGVCAGILSLGVSQHFFLWLLNYGTVGSCFSLCFIIPLSACVFRVIWLGKTGKWLAVALVLSAFLLLQWPPGAIVAGLLIVSLVISAKKWTKRKVVFLLGCALAVFMLYSRTVFLFCSEGRSHMDYVLSTSGTDSGRNGLLSAADMMARGWDHLLAHLREGHPLIVFLGVLGVFVSPYRSVRRWYVPVVAGLAIAAGWGREFVPKLQISRMGIPLLLIGVVPAGLLCARIVRAARPRLAIVRAGLAALLLLGGWNVARVYGNENVRTRYLTITHRMEEIVKWIRKNTPRDGRILFAGSAVHGYGGGHLAYLPRLTQREMVSCDYYAFPPDTTEYDMPPQRFRKTPQDMFEYMDLYNVTHIVTFHDKWKKTFRENADHYREMDSFRDITVFKVLRDSSMMRGGSGRVKASFNVLDVSLDGKCEDIVLRYNWVDGMSASEPVEIYPFNAKHGVQLIGVRPNGVQRFQLRYRRWL